MSLPSGVAGLVLAGGRSRRMGGADKAFADIGGRPMLAHVLARLRWQVPQVVISANGDLSRFAGFGCPVVEDTISGFAGPLAGVLAGMRWLETHAPHVTHVVSVSTDAPFFPRDLVSRLVRRGERGIVVAASQGREHPVIALWPVAIAEEIEGALLSGDSKVQLLQERLGRVVVEFPAVKVGGDDIDPFFNVNTAEELEQARALAAREVPPVIGIAGWKDSGKTTLVVRLIEALSRRGLRIATVKSSHHEVLDAGADGTDTARHREAGAWKTALLTPARWGVLPDFSERATPTLDEVVAELRGADLIIVEGCKGAPIPKIEVRGGSSARPVLAESDPLVIAIAADCEIMGARVPRFARDDLSAIADLILERAKA